MDAKYTPAFAWRGRLRASMGYAAGAVADLTRAATLANSGWAYAWLGEARLQFGAPAEALADLQEAVLRGAKSAEVYCWLGEAFRLNGRPAEALGAFANSLKRAKQYDRGPATRPRRLVMFRTYLGRSLVRGHLGDRAGQRDDYAAALSLRETLGAQAEAGLR